MDHDASPSLLVNSREAARILSISERTLWNLTKSGAVRCVRPTPNLVRYLVDDLRAFVARQRQEAEVTNV